jgi:hypothetical protein
MLLETTADVLALPTATDPPVRLYPLKPETEVIIKAKTNDFVNA